MFLCTSGWVCLLLSRDKTGVTDLGEEDPREEMSLPLLHVRVYREMLSHLLDEVVSPGFVTVTAKFPPFQTLF